MEKELRETSKETAYGLCGSGFELDLLGMMLGAGFMIQWAIWLIVVGIAASSLMSAGADGISWVKRKVGIKGAE